MLPVYFALALTVGLVSHYVQQRSRETAIEFIPPADKSLSKPLILRYADFLDSCSNPTYHKPTSGFTTGKLPGALQEVILQGDQRVLYDLPTLIRKENKSSEEALRLKRYCKTIEKYYAPKEHVLVMPKKDFDQIHPEGNFKGGDLPDILAVTMTPKSGAVVLLCHSAKVLSDEYVSLYCYVEAENKVDAFIRDTRLNKDNFDAHSDKTAGLETRDKDVALNAKEVNKIFYPEYRTFHTACMRENAAKIRIR